MKSLALAILLAPLFAFASLNVHPDTSLTPQGDQDVLADFNGFEAGNSGCQAATNGPRILFTGFGLFEGLDYNISGVVLQNLADTDFWPANQEPTALPAQKSGYVLKSGVLTDTDKGALISNRVLTINGKTVNACIVITNVMWDFAGAVIVHEMNRYQPNVVIMSGVGGTDGEAILESAALNTAVTMPGFNDDGSENQNNDPQLPSILDGGATSLPMTWNQQALGKLATPLLQKMNVTLDMPPQADPTNTYICNNVSYIGIAAAQSHKLELAGGKLVLQPKITSKPKLGFFHYPLDAQKAQALQWAQVILTLAAGSLN